MLSRIAHNLWKGLGRHRTFSGLGLHHFIKSANADLNGHTDDLNCDDTAPYNVKSLAIQNVYLETYGCQMNTNDSEIVLGILQKYGGFNSVSSLEAADIVLLMTCAIRENAETKIWNRLNYLRTLEKSSGRSLTIGVLGCMAERLKEKILEKSRVVDVVCGPDAYRSLPNLLQQASYGQTGINVILSHDETYADVSPVRMDKAKKSAFISIMRGCDNMCAYCIVPFTRGKERSRPIQSIIDEAIQLREQGVKEVTLLGQNVNSYRDESSSTLSTPMSISEGFRTVYKTKLSGLPFSALLERLSEEIPDVRIRFTSPHPKDFPDELLYVMRDRPNICKQIHLPAQSGSSKILEKMRRGYSRESYLKLVDHIRSIIPTVSLSSDFIVGFCGEQEEDHLDTLSLVETVGFDMAYMYAYSMREKTMAHRRFDDDVPDEVKQRRLRELIDTFYSGVTKKAHSMIGSSESVLVEGPSKKNSGMLMGRSDGNRVIVFELPSDHPNVCPGDYVSVEITHVVGSTPIGKFVAEPFASPIS